jgi:hypothetical protein
MNKERNDNLKKISSRTASHQYDFLHPTQHNMLIAEYSYSYSIYFYEEANYYLRYINTFLRYYEETSVENV